MSLSKSCKFLAATDGRDKLYKFFHYGARFLSWFCLNTANNAQWAKYWSNIDSVMSDGRKYNPHPLNHKFDLDCVIFVLASCKKQHPILFHLRHL